MFEKIFDEIDRFVPRTGANLVALDEYEPFGEKLYLLGHYETVDEANAELAQRLREGFEDRMFVYHPEVVTGPSREHLLAAGIDVDLWEMEGADALPAEMRAKLMEMLRTVA
jgi:hypothetical protein